MDRSLVTHKTYYHEYHEIFFSKRPVLKIADALFSTLSYFRPIFIVFRSFIFKKILNLLQFHESVLWRTTQYFNGHHIFAA